MAKIERLYGVDMLRGLAALSVCWFHMSNSWPEDSIIRASGRFLWVGVEVFFVISGFIIPYTMYRVGYRVEKDWRGFITKRLVRLEPPYFVALALSVGLWYLSAAMPGFRGNYPELSFAQLALHAGYLNGIFGIPWLNPVFWTLAIEFQFYLLISVVFPLLACEGKIRYLSMTILCLLGLVWPETIYVWRWLSLFFLGTASFFLLVGLVSKGKFFLILFVTVSFVYVIFGGLIAAVSCATALVIAFFSASSFRPLLFLGQISYSLYLIHVPIGGRVVNLGSRFATTDIDYLLVSMSGVGASLVFSYLFYLWVEKPSQLLAARINYRMTRKNAQTYQAAE